MDRAPTSTGKAAVDVPPLAPQSVRAGPAFAILCLGSFLAFLDIQIVSASIVEVGGGLSASPDDMSWVQTSYLIGDITCVDIFVAFAYKRAL